MYLVKSLANLTAPVGAGKLVAWTINQVRLVAAEALPYYEQNTAAFTVLAGPDFNDCLAAAIGEANALPMPNSINFLAGSGLPTDYLLGTAASLVRTSAGANNDLTFTSTAVGVASHDKTVAVVQGAGVSVPLSVSYLDGDAVITLPTDGASVALAATATAVKAAWDAVPAALAAMTVAVEGTGAGTVVVAAAAPLAGGVDTVAGTGAGVAGKGSLYMDTAGPNLKMNNGTAAAPVWINT